MVASAPGGGNDILTRVWARHLPRFLPGRPSVIVRNMPGGGGTVGGNYAYQSKPDGLTFIVSAGSTNDAYMLGLSSVRYDFKKMNAIFLIPASAVYVASSAIAKRPEDILSSKNSIFGHNYGTMAYVFLVAAEMLDIPLKTATLAYAGTGDARRALMSGEINLSADSGVAYQEFIGPLVAKGEITPLFQSGLMDEKGNVNKDPSLPSDVLTARELYEKLNGKPPSGIAWDAYQAFVAGYCKVMLSPPGMPDNVLDAWWNATDRILKDPDFRREIDPLVGPTASWQKGKAMAEAFKARSVDAKITQWVKETFANRYGIVLN
ncbi:MAG: hypothetical protein HYX90_08030 [Chloroflexi bacterium]|nr:hypothetical protein [Chloroflexota bacterium]